MRKKILPFLFGMIFLLGVGVVGMGVLIGDASQNLDKLTALHRMDRVRQGVFDSFWSIYKVLLDVRRNQPQELDAIIRNVERLREGTSSCTGCHHSDKMTSQIVQLQETLGAYEQALSFFITASANAERSERLGIEAAALGGVVLNRVEQLSDQADTMIRSDLEILLARINKAAYFFFALLFAMILAGAFLSYRLVRSFSDPISVLIEGTRQIASGRFDHEIRYKGEDEFAELARHFNEMSADLRKAYGELEERNEQLRLEIADHAKAEAERQHLLEELLDARKMEAVGTLAGGIAHEFNNLLQVVQGTAEYLASTTPEGDDNIRHIHTIQTATGRGAELTRRLLTFSRRIEGDMAPLDLNSTAFRVREMIESVLPPGISLRIETAPQPVWILGDSAGVEQVFLNLIMNARDAMPRGGELTVRVISLNRGGAPAGFLLPDDAPGVALLEVSDTGIGMDAETRRKIFEPFFTTKEVGAGTGLGLSVTYGVVREHGGTVDCDSEPGRGTTFRVWLPRIAAAASVLREIGSSSA